MGNGHWRRVNRRDRQAEVLAHDGDVAAKKLRLTMMEAMSRVATEDERGLIRAANIADPLLAGLHEEARPTDACHVEAVMDGVPKYIFSVRVSDARELARVHRESPSEADAYLKRVYYVDPMANSLCKLHRAVSDMDEEQTVRVLRGVGLLTQVGRTARFGFGHIDIADSSTRWRPLLLLVGGALFLLETVAGLRDQEAKSVLEGLIMDAESGAYGSYLAKSWEALSPKEQGEIRSAFTARVLKALQGGGLFEARTREAVLSKVAEIAEEEIGRRIGDIRQRVAAEVDKCWEERVEAVVHRKVEEALAKVKAEIAR